MKRYLLVVLLSAISAPVLASCNIGSDMPCTAGMTSDLNHTIQDKVNPRPLENLQKPSTVTNNLPSPTNPFVVPPPNDYNSNCQFGYCPPMGNPPINNIIKGD